MQSHNNHAFRELIEAAKGIGGYLAFMAGTKNRKYPVRLSPEGERKVSRLRDAIAGAEAASKEMREGV